MQMIRGSPKTRHGYNSKNDIVLSKGPLAHMDGANCAMNT